MQITVFNGSPRGRNGNTNVMVSALLDGAAAAGAEVNNVLLSEEGIKNCMGCFTCWAKTPGECAINDNMKELLKLYTGSDIVGYATPLYSGNITPMLKNFIDRLLPLVTPYIHEIPEHGFIHQLRKNKANETRYVVLSNSGFPGKDGFGNITTLFGYKNPIASIYRNCAEALTTLASRHPHVLKKVEEYKNVLYNAGSELVVHGRITPETSHELEMEILSGEEYMDLANQYWESMLK